MASTNLTKRDIERLHQNGTRVGTMKLTNKKTFLSCVDVVWFSRSKDRKFPINLNFSLNVSYRVSFSRIHSYLRRRIFKTIPAQSLSGAVNYDGNLLLYCEVRAKHDHQRNVPKTTDLLKLNEWVGVVRPPNDETLKVLLLPTSSITNKLGITTKNYPRMLHAIFMKTLSDTTYTLSLAPSVTVEEIIQNLQSHQLVESENGIVDTGRKRHATEGSLNDVAKKVKLSETDTVVVLTVPGIEYATMEDCGIKEEPLTIHCSTQVIPNIAEADSSQPDEFVVVSEDEVDIQVDTSAQQPLPLPEDSFEKRRVSLEEYKKRRREESQDKPTVSGSQMSFTVPKLKTLAYNSCTVVMKEKSYTRTATVVNVSASTSITSATTVTSTSVPIFTLSANRGVLTKNFTIPITNVSINTKGISTTSVQTTRVPTISVSSNHVPITCISTDTVSTSITTATVLTTNLTSSVPITIAPATVAPNTSVPKANLPVTSKPAKTTNAPTTTTLITYSSTPTIGVFKSSAPLTSMASTDTSVTSPITVEGQHTDQSTFSSCVSPTPTYFPMINAHPHGLRAPSPQIPPYYRPRYPPPDMVSYPYVPPSHHHQYHGPSIPWVPPSAPPIRAPGPLHPNEFQEISTILQAKEMFERTISRNKHGRSCSYSHSPSRSYSHSRSSSPRSPSPRRHRHRSVTPPHVKDQATQATPDTCRRGTQYHHYKVYNIGTQTGHHRLRNCSTQTTGDSVKMIDKDIQCSVQALSVTSFTQTVCNSQNVKVQTEANINTLLFPQLSLTPLSNEFNDFLNDTLKWLEGKLNDHMSDDFINSSLISGSSHSPLSGCSHISDGNWSDLTPPSRDIPTTPLILPKETTPPSSEFVFEHDFVSNPEISNVPPIDDMPVVSADWTTEVTGVLTDTLKDVTPNENTCAFPVVENIISIENTASLNPAIPIATSKESSVLPSLDVEITGNTCSSQKAPLCADTTSMEVETKITNNDLLDVETILDSQSEVDSSLSKVYYGPQLPPDMQASSLSKQSVDALSPDPLKSTTKESYSNSGNQSLFHMYGKQIGIKRSSLSKTSPPSKFKTTFKNLSSSNGSDTTKKTESMRVAPFQISPPKGNKRSISMSPVYAGSSLQETRSMSAPAVQNLNSSMADPKIDSVTSTDISTSELSTTTSTISDSNKNSSTLTVTLSKRVLKDSTTVPSSTSLTVSVTSAELVHTVSTSPIMSPANSPLILPPITSGPLPILPSQVTADVSDYIEQLATYFRKTAENKLKSGSISTTTIPTSPNPLLRPGAPMFETNMRPPVPILPVGSAPSYPFALPFVHPMQFPLLNPSASAPGFVPPPLFVNPPLPINPSPPSSINPPLSPVDPYFLPTVNLPPSAVNHPLSVDPSSFTVVPPPAPVIHPPLPVDPPPLPGDPPPLPVNLPPLPVDPPPPPVLPSPLVSSCSTPFVNEKKILVSSIDLLDLKERAKKHIEIRRKSSGSESSDQELSQEEDSVHMNQPSDTTAIESPIKNTSKKVSVSVDPSIDSTSNTTLHTVSTPLNVAASNESSQDIFSTTYPHLFASTASVGLTTVTNSVSKSTAFIGESTVHTPVVTSVELHTKITDTKCQPNITQSDYSYSLEIARSSPGNEQSISLLRSPEVCSEDSVVNQNLFEVFTTHVNTFLVPPISSLDSEYKETISRMTNEPFSEVVCLTSPNDGRHDNSSNQSESLFLCMSPSSSGSSNIEELLEEESSQSNQYYISAMQQNLTSNNETCAIISGFQLSNDGGVTCHEKISSESITPVQWNTFAVIIQSYWRGYVARKQYTILQKGFTLLQARIRGFLVKCRYEKVKKACFTLQKAMRGYLVRSWFQKVQASIVVLQSLIRGVLLRKEVFKRTAAIVKLQSMCRRTKARSRFVALKKNTIKVQALYRGNKEKKKWLQFRKCVILLQALYRGKTARKNWLQIKEAAIKIQAFYRGYKARKKWLQYKHHVTKIQSLYRGIIQRKQWNCIKKSIIKIQSNYRANKGRNNWLRLKTNVIRMQATYRGNKERKRWLHFRNCVVRIQSFYRGSKARNQWHQMKNSVIRMQAIHRGRTQRKKWLDYREHVLKIQAIYKGKKERKCWLQFRESVVKFQAIYRCYRERKQWLYLRELIVRIQSVFRGYRLRRSYNQFRSSVIKIQSFYRGYKVRQYYTKLERSVIVCQSFFRLHRRYKHFVAALVRFQSLSRGSLARSNVAKNKALTANCMTSCMPLPSTSEVMTSSFSTVPQSSAHKTTLCSTVPSSITPCPSAPINQPTSPQSSSTCTSALMTVEPNITVPTSLMSTSLSSYLPSFILTEPISSTNPSVPKPIALLEFKMVTASSPSTTTTTSAVIVPTITVMNMSASPATKTKPFTASGFEENVTKVYGTRQHVRKITACSIIQKHYRAYRKRKEERLMFLKQMKAAVTIQAWWRKRLAAKQDTTTTMTRSRTRSSSTGSSHTCKRFCSACDDCYPVSVPINESIRRRYKRSASSSRRSKSKRRSLEPNTFRNSNSSSSPTCTNSSSASPVSVGTVAPVNNVSDSVIDHNYLLATAVDIRDVVKVTVLDTNSVADNNKNNSNSANTNDILSTNPIDDKSIVPISDVFIAENILTVSNASTTTIESNISATPVVDLTSTEISPNLADVHVTAANIHIKATCNPLVSTSISIIDSDCTVSTKNATNVSSVNFSDEDVVLVDVYPATSSTENLSLTDLQISDVSTSSCPNPSYNDHLHSHPSYGGYSRSHPLYGGYSHSRPLYGGYSYSHRSSNFIPQERSLRLHHCDRRSGNIPPMRHYPSPFPFRRELVSRRRFSNQTFPGYHVPHSHGEFLDSMNYNYYHRSYNYGYRY